MKGNNMKKQYQASCACGYKSRNFNNLDSAIEALDKHSHKKQITEWTEVRRGIWNGKKIA